MDRRDAPLWTQAASSHYARMEKAMAQAAAFPNMEAQDRTKYMQTLVDIINGPKAVTDGEPTPEQEAEWARNREELAVMFGRVG